MAGVSATELVKVSLPNRDKDTVYEIYVYSLE